MSVDDEEQYDIEKEKKHEDLEWWVPVIVLLAVVGCVTIIRRGLEYCRRRRRTARPPTYPKATAKKRGKAIIEDIKWKPDW